MSYEVTVTIRCDAPQCDVTWFDTRMNRGGLNKTMAAVFAESQGWDITGKDPRRAFCPDHKRTGI